MNVNCFARPRRLFPLLLSLLTYAMLLSGQSAGTGALSGSVTDASGAVIPQVAVTAIREGGESRATTTDAAGTFRFALLTPGNYTIRFSASGFKAVEVPSAVVNVTETTNIDQKLEVGSQSEEVTVEATAARLQTDSSTVGDVVGQQQVSTLPLTNRNYTQVLTLAAGVQGSVTNAAVLGRGTQDVSVNGAGVNQNNFQQDGVEINNFMSGVSGESTSFYGGIAVPNPDSLEQFKIQTSSYDAGYGRNAGANVNVVTKSGSNAFHGSVWEFFRNTDLNANDFFLNRSGQPRAPFRQNQFGGTFGGPVKKDKLFFFGSYQGTRQVNGLATQGHSSAFLPPLTNDRSAPTLGAQFCNSKTFFPETLQVACDGSNISPAALAILNAKLSNGTYYIPTPQSIRNGVGFSSWSIPARFTEDQFVINSDYLLSSKHTLSARVFASADPWELSFSGNGQVPGSAYKQYYGNSVNILKLTSVLSPSMVNEARASFTRIPVSTHTGEPLTATGVGVTPVQADYNYLPVINVSGLFSAGGFAVDTFSNYINQFQWSDQLSWSRGKQTIRVGFQAERIQWNNDQIGNSRGTLTFLSFPDFLLGQSAQTSGSALGIGNVYSATASLYPANGVVDGWRVNAFSGFLQDDLKVSPRLTLNVGVRWEFNGLMSDKYGNLSNVWQSLLLTQPVPPPGGSLVGYTVPSNFPGPVPAGVYKRDNETPLPSGQQPLTNFGPRAGFAWQPLANGHLVIRGGAGLFFDRPTGNDIATNVVFTSPPLVPSEGGTGVAEGLGTLANPWNPFVNFGFPLRTANFATGASSNIVAGIFAETMPNPVVQEYNLNAQYELPWRMLFEVGYVGSHGIHLQTKHPINQPSLASASSPVNGVTTNTTQNAVLRVPYVGFSPVGLNMVTNNGDMRYNSAVASLKKSLSNGVQFGAAYTWNTDLTDILATVQLGGNQVINNVNNVRQMWGPSSIARAQRLVANFTYSLPTYHLTNGILAKLSEGWSIAGVATAQTGFFMTPTDSRGGTIYGSVGTSTGTPCPGITASQLTTSGSVTSRLNNYFNTSAFCAPAVIGNGTDYGTLGQGDTTGPGQFNWDVTLVKSTPVRVLFESARLDFRAEFFNVFNHPQFSNPNLAIGTANFGTITSTSVTPRLIQFALKYIF